MALQELAQLLYQLKTGGHKALIFTQMTKMLDVLEAFLNLHGYTYLRLDGSTKPEQRQASSRLNLLIVGSDCQSKHRIASISLQAAKADTLPTAEHHFLKRRPHVCACVNITTRPLQQVYPQCMCVQILMQRFNSNPKIFVFILSTRSGGVGMNLTGADTVIFYDSDWNPAMDAQVRSGTQHAYLAMHAPSAGL